MALQETHGKQPKPTFINSVRERSITTLGQQLHQAGLTHCVFERAEAGETVRRACSGASKLTTLRGEPAVQCCHNGTALTAPETQTCTKRREHSRCS